MPESLWNTAQCAEYLNISEKTLRRWQAGHAVPFVKIGGAIRYEPDTVREWVRRSAAVAAGDADRHLQALGLR